MAVWNPIQHDFSGGAVDLGMIMREDLAVYRKSVLLMQNWMPMLTGSAVRTPGTRWVLDVAEAATGTPQQVIEARIVPYLTQAQERVLLQLTDSKVTALSNLEESVVGVNAVQAATGVNRKQVLPNPEFFTALDGWDVSPDWFTGGAGDQLGVRWVSFNGEGAAECVCRNWKYPGLDNESCLLQTVGVIDVPTSKIQFNYRVVYNDNFGLVDNDYIARIRIGTSVGANDIGEIDLTNKEIGIYQGTEYYDMGAPYTGDIHVEFFLQATEFRSAPQFFLDSFTAFVNSDEVIEGVDLVSPYLASELTDVQYLQSPHGNKEMVFVHPNHPPQWLYFDPNTDQYVMEPIPFDVVPGEWDVKNYPSTLTAYQGRLLLSGVPSDPEIVWGSETFEWDKLDIPTEPLPNSPIKFVTTFRSPTKWMAGQKALIVGAQELEYIVQADAGLLTSGDIDARVHSTHGGAAVQPVGYGQYVAFAADRGTRLRAIQANRDNEGWIAPDKSILNPTLLRPGIKRIVRMRNPHQMVVCLLKNGRLAILHEDTTAGIAGWSNIDIGSSIKDVCVMPTNDGLDVLYCVVDRTVGQHKHTYLEAFHSWAGDLSWIFPHSHRTFSYEEPTSVIDGLEHLEGNRVQVVSDTGFVGNFRVTGGQVSLVDGNGNAQYVNTASVGMVNRSIMITLPAPGPVEAGGAGAMKRYSSISVRGLISSMVKINGERPSERQPFAKMNISQPLALLQDFSVTNLGHDLYAQITIEEDLPIRAEVLGIYGKLSGHKI